MKKNETQTDLLGPITHGRHHKKPTTRRDFLSQGMISGVSVAMTPSLLSMVSQRALGMDCAPEASDDGRIPFLCLDLAGGANIAGSNVMVGKRGGQQDFLNDYQSLSLTNAVSPLTSTANLVALNGNMNDSLLFHAQSPFFRGFSRFASETTRANMDGVIFCAASFDDSGVNPHNPVYWISKAGLEGKLVPLVGSRNTRSGGRSDAPASSLNPLKRPVVMTGPESTQGLVDLGLLGELLNPDKAEKIMKAVSAMSDTQLQRFNEKQLPEKMKELVQCGYINSASMITEFGPDQLDPRQDAIITSVYENDFRSNSNGQSSAITKLVLDGFAGAGTLELGGYDYHTGDFRSERLDEMAGSHAGRMFEAAAQKGIPLILYCYTDGGVSAQRSGAVNGKFPWRSDSGQRASTFMMIYDPKGKPKIRNGNRQIGWFNDAGAVDTSATPISSSVENLTKLIVANYLAIQGREGELANIVGNNPFGDELEKMLSFSQDTLNT